MKNLAESVASPEGRAAVPWAVEEARQRDDERHLTVHVAPPGEALLGSMAQHIILGASGPVIAVKGRGPR